MNPQTLIADVTIPLLGFGSQTMTVATGLPGPWAIPRRLHERAEEWWFDNQCR